MFGATFSALRDRRYAVFLLGMCVSNMGTWMERSALAALVYQLSGHDERWLAYVGFVPMIPVALLSIPAGAWVDRLDVRKLVLAMQFAMMFLSAVLAVGATFGALQPWHIIVYAVLASGCFAVDAPGRQALVPRIVDRAHLTNAIALNAVSFNSARLLGGVAFFAVMSFTGWGEAGCFWINTISFVVPIAGLLTIRERMRDPVLPHPHGDDFRSGLRFAWRTPAVRGALLILMSTGMLGFQVSHLIPVYAEKVWGIGKAGQGTLHAWFGVGALLGGLSLAMRHSNVHRGRLIARCSVISSVLLVVFALSPSAAIGRVVLAVAGFFLIQTHSASNALIQSRVPDALRGRVVALFTLAVLGSFPVGGLIGGFVARAIGAPATTLLDAQLLVAATVAIWWSHRDLREAK
ncbi:MAG: MFS transporter [Planctomycetes bacterium]|nr:MFS transporter [Planctomycetota bacterium]